MPLPNEPVVRLRDARVVYPGGHEALQRCAIAFERGAFNVLLGPSGAGKSTLLRSLNGLVPLTEGELHVAGIGRVADRRALHSHRRGTGMVFQQHQLIGRLTAHRNVLIGRLGYHGTLRSMLPFAEADRVIAFEALERVGLLDHALRRVDQLSGGQQQRVGIARALAQQPRLLLADEPVASLDPATSARVLDLMRTICKADGITAVVSLHQVELARAFADRVVGIANGRIVFDGPPRNLDDVALAAIYGAAPAVPQLADDDFRAPAPAGAPAFAC